MYSANKETKRVSGLTILSVYDRGSQEQKVEKLTLRPRQPLLTSSGLLPTETIADNPPLIVRHTAGNRISVITGNIRSQSSRDR